jgi:undecaprenyl diphosphate synthase
MHVAIILDGNGRWARAQGWPRLAGHRAGVEAVRQAVEAGPAHGVQTLSLYAFSSDNWKRPLEEVNGLMALLGHFLEREVTALAEKHVRLEFIGRRDRLPATLVRAMDAAEQRTRTGRRLHLRIAVDYSGRESIRTGHIGPDVDLLIRTGGEQRLSDFLLWECAYAELLFLPKAWPEFTAADLGAAVMEFHQRHRRFGAIA